MLIYVRQFVKIRVVFLTLYLWNELCASKFLVISDTSNSSSDSSKTKIIYQQENFRANFLKFELMLLFCTKSNYTETKSFHSY